MPNEPQEFPHGINLKNKPVEGSQSLEDYHVSKTKGDDTLGDGTPLNPYKTIDKVITTHGGSGTIIIRIDIGDYSDNLTITGGEVIIVSEGWVMAGISGTISIASGADLQLRDVYVSGVITGPAVGGAELILLGSSWVDQSTMVNVGNMSLYANGGNISSFNGATWASTEGFVYDAAGHLVTLSVNWKISNPTADDEADTQGARNSAISSHAGDASAHHTRPVQATESALGIAEIATQAETDTGTDDTRIVTPLKLANYSGMTSVRKFIMQMSPGLTPSGNQTAYFASWGGYTVRGPAESRFFKSKVTRMTINVTTNSLTDSAVFYVHLNGVNTGTAITFATTETGRKTVVLDIDIADGDLVTVEGALGGIGAGSIGIKEINLEVQEEA